MHRLLRPLPGRGRGRGGPARASVGFVTARGETSINPDPIALLRGAPHRELAIAFIEFVLSDEGQKLWSFRRGVPGGPERYTLRRLPIVPRLYDHAFDAYRADPDENPYEEARDFVYHRAWTGPLYSALAFVVRVMCVDPERELQEAYDALARAGFPPEATALFDDVSAVDYAKVVGAGAGRAAVGGSDGRGALDDPPGERIPRAIPARDRAGAGGKVNG